MWWVILSAAFFAAATGNYPLGAVIALVCAIWGDFE
jgi:hypothetical protein